MCYCTPKCANVYDPRLTSLVTLNCVHTFNLAPDVATTCYVCLALYNKGESIVIRTLNLAAVSMCYCTPKCANVYDPRLTSLVTLNCVHTFNLAPDVATTCYVCLALYNKGESIVIRTLKLMFVEGRALN